MSTYNFYGKSYIPTSSKEIRIAVRRHIRYVENQSGRFGIKGQNKACVLILLSCVLIILYMPTAHPVPFQKYGGL